MVFVLTVFTFILHCRLFAKNVIHILITECACLCLQLKWTIYHSSVFTVKRCLELKHFVVRWVICLSGGNIMWDIWEQTMTFYDRPEWRVQSSVLHNFIVIQLIYLWCVEVWALFTTLSDINYKHLYEGLKACCPPRPVVLFWYLNAGSRIFRRK